MSTRYLHCRFLSYWHPGTGGGLGAWLDARARAVDGLPLVPGRTLKGVLRDAVYRAEALGWFGEWPRSDGNWTDHLFGKEASEAGASVPGVLRVGSAELEAATLAAFHSLPTKEERTEALRGMRSALHQTALNDDGVAKDSSLRGMEVYVPMPLVAPLEWIGSSDSPDAATAFKVLARSLSLVEGLGAHRTRGLGRVELQLEDRP